MTYRVYGDLQSGNCYKVKLLLEHLGLDYEWMPVDILAGDTQTAEFLQMNPTGKIPLLELPDGTYLSESNAILYYLAEGSPWLPEDRLQRATVLQWMFFEQYSHEPCIAVARFIEKYLGLPDERREEYISKQQGGYKALQVMEQQLEKTSFIAGNTMTIADIALYAYTHVAHEGGFDLSGYPLVCAWLNRIAERPGHITIG
ncbi:glutathione S-transferase family protein [Endozoicomonadaceae bacterium StTr2]